MKLSAALAPAEDLWLAISIGFIPTLIHILHNPHVLFSPKSISHFFFSHIWSVFSPGADENSRKVKKTLIPGFAEGVVMEVGAGHGTTMHYLDRKKVTKYIAVEPNVLMHGEIRKTGALAGFDEAKGELIILSCGAADIPVDLGEFVDTLISILTICSIPEPQKTLRALCTYVLKPGGQFLFYEHVASHRRDVRWWQSVWSPVWKIVFDGCVLDRPTDQWIQGLGIWEEDSKMWGKEGESEENLWWHRVGRFVRRSD